MYGFVSAEAVYRVNRPPPRYILYALSPGPIQLWVAEHPAATSSSPRNIDSNHSALHLLHHCEFTAGQYGYADHCRFLRGIKRTSSVQFLITPAAPQSYRLYCLRKGCIQRDYISIQTRDSFSPAPVPVDHSLSPHHPLLQWQLQNRRPQKRRFLCLRLQSGLWNPIIRISANPLADIHDHVVAQLRSFEWQSTPWW